MVSIKPKFEGTFGCPIDFKFEMICKYVKHIVWKIERKNFCRIQKVKKLTKEQN